MSNQVVSAAIERLNAANIEAASTRAAAVITKIQNLQVESAASVKRVAELSAEANKLQQPEITETTILGSPLPPAASQNLNQQTIAKAIADLAKGKQGGIACKASRLAEGIVAEQAQGALIDEAIAKLQKELSEITPEVVTESEITGQ